MKLKLAVSASLVLSSCDAYPPDIHDLKAQSANFVEPGVLSKLQTQDPPAGDGPFLRVTVSSGINLVRRSTSSEMNVYPIVVSCSERDSGLFAYGPYLDGLHVSALHLDQEHPRFAQLASERRDRFSYELYIPVSGQFRSERDINKRIRAYDFRRRPEDLCVKVGGGNMVGGRFRSNEVRVTPPKGAPSQ